MHTAQLTPYRYRRTTNLLKLTDAPTGCPGRYCFGHVTQAFASFAIFLTIERIAIDVLGNVFGDVAGSAAFGGINTFNMEAGAAGNPLATEFNARVFSAYREQRLSGKITRSTRVKTVTPRPVNLELAYFRAVFNELRRLDEWKAPNPLENIREFKIGESEMAYLTIDEIRVLLAECDKSRSQDLTTIVKICLATGARWSKAEGLKGNQVRAGQIIYMKTKGKKNRAVPITEKLLAELPASRKAQPLFTPCYSAFRKAMQRAGIETPAGQLTHVLRHTFASHFMMNGGNILVLQRILGHTDIKVTMRYAHFAPDHFTEAILLNPLSKLSL